MFPSSRFFPLIIAALLLSSCFGKGIDTRGSVIAYRKGVIETEGGRFRVGNLPAPWKPKKFGMRAIVFENPSTGETISVDAFCKRSADDAALAILSDQLFYGFTNQKILSRRLITLDGREALHSVLEGTLDGSRSLFETVVLKKDQCVFDFLRVARPGMGLSADFKMFYGDFHLVAGPPISIK